MDKNKIRKEAKQLLNKFSKALEKVDNVKVEEHYDREEFERAETISSESDDSEKSINDESMKNSSFKSKLLGNAPRKDDNFIIAEKGSWK